MKKILGVSLVALMAVSTARADIASTTYVTGITGALGDLTTSQKGNLVAAINSINTTAGGAVVAAQGSGNANKAMITNASGNVEPGSITSGMITDATITTDDLAATIVTSLGKADSAVQSVVEGDGNGQIKVDGTNVNVHGLGSAAYEAATAFDAAGTASGLVGTLPTGKSTVVAYIEDVANQITTGAVNSVSLSSGTNNGTVKLTVDGTDYDNIAVTGLGSAAYTASTAYASAAQGALADTAVQPANITTGTTNGTIKVGDTPVAVYGLDSAAYTASTAYLPAVASNSTATDGTYVLTMKVSGDTQVLAWETISRTNQ